MNQHMLSGAQPIADIFELLVTQNPAAYAEIKGLQEEAIEGYVFFFPLWEGSLITAYVTGLPSSKDVCSPHFFGFHIHNQDVHYNPNQCPHPAHAGDFPPLLSSSGFAWQMFYTEYFTPMEVLGMKTVIHAHADDFTSQPSGNSGEMIAAGQIRPYSKISLDFSF